MFNIQQLSRKNRRRENQDNYWWGTFHPDGTDKVGILAVVADGMGGLAQGRKASQVSADCFRELLHAGDISDAKLMNTVREAHEKVSQFENKSGSTIDVLRIFDGNYFIAHLGDSRVYRVPAKGKKADLLTYDHSALNDLKERGVELTPEVIKKNRPLLTRGIGRNPWLPPVSYFGKYHPGDAFLMCSDGFWHSFEYHGSLIDVSDPQCLKTLADDCRKIQETDNITALLIQEVDND